MKNLTPDSPYLSVEEVRSIVTHLETGSQVAFCGDDNLLGEVSGLYINHVRLHGIKMPNTKFVKIGDEHYEVILNGCLISCGKNQKLTTVYRKLKRMLKCRKLNVVKHNIALEDWLQIKQ